jgi:hypothetical protein
MSSKALLLPFVLLLGCAGATPTGERSDDNQIVSTDGPLRLTVTDAPSMMGVLYARPTATVAPSAVTVTNTRYGSICLYAVTGHADVGANTITLRITFAQRLTICTADIRSLTYRAEVSGLSQKAYDLLVIHEESGKSDSVLTQHLVVP